MSSPSHPSLASAHQLHLITNRIRQSLDLEAILTTTVTEVWNFLGIDRVKIYQFQNDGHGIVQAEARTPVLADPAPSPTPHSALNDALPSGPDQASAPNGITYRLPSLLGLHFPADDVPLFARELYLRQRQRTIVNTQTQEIGISPLISPETGAEIDSTTINYRLVDPCHLEYLRAMGVQASLVLPIVVDVSNLHWANGQQDGGNHPGGDRAGTSINPVPRDKPQRSIGAEYPWTGPNRTDRDPSDRRSAHHTEKQPDHWTNAQPSAPTARSGQPNPAPQPTSLFSLPPHKVLWGLLVAHHSEPYEFGAEALEMVQGIVDQVAIAIAQSILLEQMRIQNHQESTLNALTRLLYRTPNIELQAALEATVDIFKGCGGRLYVLDNSKIHLPDQDADQVQSSLFREGPKIYTMGSQPDSLDDSHDRPLEDSLIFQNYLQSLIRTSPHFNPDQAERTPSAAGNSPSSPPSLTSPPPAPLPLHHLRAAYNLTTATSVSSPSGVWAVGDLYQEPLLRPVSMAFQGTKIRSLLVIPLVQGNELLGCLTLFRNEVDQELLWAGAQDPDKRQMAPRQSFDIWRQIKKGQAQSWESKDVSLAQRVGECFAAAVKQYHLYQRVQILNQSLVRQVEIRTMELEHSNRMVQQQQALARILAKLQKATDITSVFRSATDEVRQLLGVDRVAIYQFNEDWGGGFIQEYDSVSPGWRHLILAGRSDWNDSYLQESQGGRYRFHEISAVEDIYKANLSACHLGVLEYFYIRAFLVVPIFVSRHLWGLLGIYNHDNPRPWKESETVFATQIAAHLGTALQYNAQFLQTQREAERVPVMLEQQQTLAGVISKIRESLDLDTIFTTTTKEVRKLLQADRVGVFQFLPETQWTEGQFVAENVAHGYRSALEAKVQDRCFGEDHRHRYQDGAIQAIADIYDANLSDCHRVILEAFQVRANLVVPLTLGQELWGLLCIHQCSRPRQWETWEIKFVQQIAEQLGVALYQAQLLRESQDSQILANTANRSKSEFLANMSHELRTPLNAVLGLSEGLREGVYGELQPYQAQVLATIEKSGQHLLALINDILDVAKIEAGKIELELVPVSLQKLCNTSLNFVQQAAHQKNLKLKLSLPNSPPPIILGELRVRQILLNLLSNAVKFTPNGGEISLIVDLKPEQEVVQFQVKDTGIGIAPENLQELFQPFVQIDSRLSRQYSGTGLGLALVKRLVEMHKGTVTVTSILGEGSCFTVVLPYQQTTQPSQPQTTPAPLSASPSAIAEATTPPAFPPKTPPTPDSLDPTGDPEHLPPALPPETAPSKALTDALVLDNPEFPSLLAAQSQSHVQFPPHPSPLTGPLPDRLSPRPAAETTAQSPDLTVTVSSFDDLQPTSSLDLTPNSSLTRLNLNIACGDGTKPLVLLAEDNVANIDTFSSYLSYRGYCLIVASDGYEAVRLAQEYKPQAILMDIQMPGMDGLEAIAAIRQIPELANVPILALTALAMAGDRERCLEAGATEYLSKPVRMQYLHHTLQTLLKANAET